MPVEICTRDVDMQQIKDIVVIGLGNPLMTDDGVGIYVVRELAARPEFADCIDFVELSDSFMGVIHAIKRTRKAVLIDCVCMNRPAGTMRRFTPNDVVDLKMMTTFSLHQGDVLNALKLSRQLGEYPDDVVIFGIQPQRVTPGGSLSPVLRRRLVEYVEMICAELPQSSSAFRQLSQN
jgi:hydrogenase maturation protease